MLLLCWRWEREAGGEEAMRVVILVGFLGPAWSWSWMVGGRRGMRGPADESSNAPSGEPWGQSDDVVKDDSIREPPSISTETPCRLDDDPVPDREDVSIDTANNG